MNVKAVVKVMNFHSLLRVDAARHRAEQYEAMKDELEAMMRIVLNNRNLRLDKLVRLPDPKLPVLRIYLGSDLGFCGNVNSAVASVMRKDSDKEKIAIGKKIHKAGEVSLFLSQEDFNQRSGEVIRYLERAVRERCWSAVEIIYNHYYNMSSVRQETKRIYPLEMNPEESRRGIEADFLFEGEPERLLENMMISYLIYELHIVGASSFASENIMRQNATSESLKKLDEMEAEELRIARKERKLLAVQKTTDSYIKQKSLERM